MDEAYIALGESAHSSRLMVESEDDDRVGRSLAEEGGQSENLKAKRKSRSDTSRLGENMQCMLKASFRRE